MINAPFLLLISEKYNNMGTIAADKVESGNMRTGDTLILILNKAIVKVTATFDEMENEVSSALYRNNVRILLYGVDEEDIS